METEHYYIETDAEFNLQPNMIFSVDTWLEDKSKGIGHRWEDGVRVTDDGVEELSNYRMEIISV